MMFPFSRILLSIVLWLGLIQQAAAQPSKILVLGDSLSAAYNIPVNEGWVELLGSTLTEHNLSYTLVNASISGETTAGGRARLPELLNQHKPEWVIVELGGNDGLRGFPLSYTENNLQAIIEMAQAANAQVLLLGMQLPPNYGETYTDAFTGIFSRLAEQQDVLLVPFFLEGVGGNGELMQKDGIHPTAEAQPIMRDHVWRVLQPALD